MSTDLTVIYTGIRNKLTGDAGVTAQVGTRIYKKMAPANVDMPYLRYYVSAGGYLNIVAGDLFNVLVTVEAFANTDAGATDAFESAFTALHRQTLTVSGFVNYWCMAERYIDLPPELVKGELIYRVGADFRICLDRD